MLFPESHGFSLAAQAFLRTGYGVLLLLTLLQALPQARRFFVSERWRGYAKSDRWVDLFQNPYTLPFILAAWVTSGLLLVLGRHTVLASLVNLVLCHYYFVRMRWKGVLRGMGAPGFMTYWLGACVFFLEYGLACDPTGSVRDAAVLAFRVDFALIMLCAGAYKALAGYASNDGMELGMVNPFWGYWGSIYRRLPPGHWLFRGLNHLAWSTEIAAGLLLLFPPAQLLGALLVMGSFLFIALHIRLGFLAEMVILCGFLFVPEGSFIDRLVPPGLVSATVPAGLVLPASVNRVLSLGLYGYVVLLPFAKVGQYYNFLAKRALPGILQQALDRYTSFFGIMIWRVFSSDHTNFYARILLEDPTTGLRRPYARPGALDWRTRFRYMHVGEFVCLTSLFTTLKYYPSSDSLFSERLVRYARTIPCPKGCRVLFEYVSIRKDGGRFRDVPTALYSVDPERAAVDFTILDDSVSVKAKTPSSPIHEASRPGSYAPATGR